MPLLIASSRISGKPSNREEQHEHRRLGHVGADVLGGALDGHRALEPVLLDQPAVAALEVAAAAQPQRPVRVRLRRLRPGRDQQLEALLVAEAPGRVDGLGAAGRPSRRAAAAPCWGCGAAATRAVEQLRSVVPRGRVRSARRTRRGAGRACASSCAAPPLCLLQVHLLEPDRAQAGRAQAREHEVHARARAEEDAGAAAQPAHELDVGPDAEARRGAVGRRHEHARELAQEPLRARLACAGRRGRRPARRPGRSRRTARRDRGSR